MTDRGPVSAFLAADLVSMARKHGVVVWLDRECDYTPLADALIADEGFPIPVTGWRGSYLELMLALEPVASGIDPSPAVVHMPGFLPEDIHTTPLLELYRAGRRYYKKLSTLVGEAAAGKVPPEALDAILATPSLTLEAADAWLAAQLAGDGASSLPGLAAMGVELVVSALLDGGLVSAEATTAKAQVAELIAHLGVRLGVAAGWSEQVGVQPAGAADVAFVASAWALCVEYVHDLHRPPFVGWLQPLAGLHKPLVEACTGLARHLRSRHPDHYRQVASAVEPMLVDDETRLGSAEDLGAVDTFWFEEEVILRAALAALGRDQFDAACAWADARRAGESIWLRGDELRRGAWELVGAAAALGRAIQRTPDLLEGATTLAEAVDRYTTRGAAVDRAHRHLAQRRAALWHTRLPEYAGLRACLAQLDQDYAAWARDLASSFSSLCQTVGFVPQSTLQQRTLFDEVVRPMAAEPGITVYFLVDALRYEMAQELAEAIGSESSTRVTLRARLAELPSESAVGMNVLAPVVSNGRLRPVWRKKKIAGFQAAEFQVIEPGDRRRAIREAVGGACPELTLQEVIDSSPSTLRNTINKSKVQVVDSKEIDVFGHKGAGPGMFDNVLQRLRAACRLLREAGAKRFVITADHGFLLIENLPALKAEKFGRRIDAKRRYALWHQAEDPDGLVRVALSDLRYDGTDEHLILTASTALFDNGQPDTPFVHGGNSLQERVIPVLTVQHHRAAGAEAAAYRLSADVRQGLLDLHCVSVTATTVAQHALDFGRSKELELALRVVDQPPDVSLAVADARAGARLEGGVVRLRIGERGEVFFRLQAASERTVQVELFHPGTAEVDRVRLPDWLTATARKSTKPPLQAPPAAADTGVASLPDGPREVFEHLVAYGSVSEADVIELLGSPRAARAFARNLEEYARSVRFDVRVEQSGFVKQYVRVGSDG